MVGVHSIHLPLITEGFPGGSDGKESTCNEGDLGSIPGLRRFPGEKDDYPLQYSGLENSMDCIVHGVAKSQTQLSNFHFTLRLKCLPPMWETRVSSLGREDLLEKGMASHSSILGFPLWLSW